MTYMYKVQECLLIDEKENIYYSESACRLLNAMLLCELAFVV